MAETIGLEAVFDLSSFNKGIGGYTKSLSGATKDTTRAAGSMGKAWNDLGKNVAGVAKTMAVGIAAAGVAAGAAIAGFAVSGIKKAADLQAQMSNIAAIFNTTAENVAPLKDLIMELGLDPNLTVSTMEAAEAIEMLGKNGLTMQQIIDGAARSTVLLANATGADFGTAADIATDVMAQFNIDAGNMSTAIDGIVSVTNASKLTIDDYRLAIGQAGGVAAGVGVELNDFNTVLAGTASRFAGGSDSGTAFKTMLQRLIPQSKEAHGLMTDLGLITTDWDKAATALNLTLDGTQNTSNQVFEAFRDIQMTQSDGKITTDELNEAWAGFIANFDDSAFFDANGNLEDMNEIAVALQATMGDLTEEQRLNALTTLAGTDAARTMLGLIDLGAVAYTDAALAAKELEVSQEEVNKVIEGGVTQFEALQLTMGQTDAARQAEERNRNLAAALKILGDTIESVQMAIGDLFLPMLEEMARSLNDLIKENSPAIIAFFESLRDWLETAIPQAIEGFKGTWATLSAAFVTVRDAVIPVATALGDIAATLTDNLGPILLSVNPNMDALKGALTGIAAILAAATITAGITAMAGAIASLFTPIGLVILAAAGLGAAWNTNWMGIRDITTEVVSDVQQQLGPLLETLQTLGGGILQTIRDHWQEIAAGIAGFSAVLLAAKIPAAFTAITTAVTVARTAIIASLAAINIPLLLVAATVAILAAAWTGNWFGMRDATMQALGEIQTAFTPLTTAIQEFGSSALTEIQNFVTGNETEFTNLKAIWDGATLSVGNLTAKITEQFPLLTPVFNGFSTAVSLVVQQVQAQFIFLTAGVAAMVSLIGALISGNWALAWQSAQDLAGAFVTYVTTTFANLSEVFSGPLNTIKTLVTDTFTNLSATVSEKLPGWQASLAEWGTSAWQWLQDAAAQLLMAIGGWALTLTTYVDNNLETWKSSLAEWGLAAWEWIAAAILVVGEQMATWGTAVLGYVTDNLETWKTNLLSWGNAAWQWIVNAIPSVATQMGEWGTAVLGYVTDNYKTWQTNLADWTKTAWQWIVDAVPLVSTQIGTWGQTVFNYLDNNLETWKANLLKWTQAAWEWIVDAVPLIKIKIGEWYTELVTALTPHLTTFGVEMLKWAKELVEWILDSSADPVANLDEWLQKIIAWIPTGVVLLAAETLKLATALVEWVDENAIDALGALGEWLGKIVAWIPLGVIALGGAVIKLAGALVGWIMGGGGISVEDSAAGQLDTEFEKFKTALGNALTTVWEGFKVFVQEFVRSFADTMSEYIDWEFVGTNIMTFVRNGISSMLDPIIGKVTEIVNAAKDVWTTVVDWLQTGKDVIQKVIDGLQAMLDLGTLATKAGELATSAKDEFLAIDWLQLGKDIIDGILKGLQEDGQAIIDYILELGQQALDSITGLFDTGSPSRVMMQLGRDIIEGWLIGMRSQENRLYAAIQHISDGVARIAGRAGANAIAAYTSALSSFSSVGGSLLDRLGGSPGATSASQLIGDEQRTLAFLQEQADLIEAIRSSGADPADVLRGVTLGPNADPVRLAQIVGFTMANLNHQLMISLQNAASGLDREIEDARARREDIAAIEERFQEQTFDARSNYARRLASIDEQIAQAESDAIRTGNRNVLLRIQSLDHQRDAIVKEFELLITHQRQLEDILARQPVSDNQRGQAAIERWRQTMIDPLLNGFEHLAAGVRAARLQDIDRHMRLIQGFAAQLPMLAGAEARLMQALEGFGTGARNRAEQLLNLVYDPRMASVAAGRAQAVHDFANSLINLRGQLQHLSGQRLTGESIIERMMGGFDQMTAYQNALEAVDRQIANMEAHIMETGNVNALNTIRSLDATRAQRQADIENFVRQTQALESIMRQVKNFSGPGQASAERFFQEQIQTIADAFSSPMRSVDRDAWIRTAQTRVEMINRFVEQMRQLERVQNRVAGNQNFAHLADEFAQLQDILMPETQRGSLINQLNSYITQMMRLHQIQQDISVGRGINPLVERFASERLDAVARQLENINLTEAERNRLIEQYRIEQEKILAIQQKQQQLDFINQQLALINQLRSLDDEEGWSVDVENILSGIGLGMNASIDDLMRLTGRVLDELVRFANHELGIASPSKVFAKVGMNLMAGLESGIMAGMRQPMNALRSAAGNLIPYSLSQRALNINMGGVTINDGMDAVMFEARIRQIVRSEFAA